MGSYDEPPSKKRRFLGDAATSSPGALNSSSPALSKPRFFQDADEIARSPLSERDAANECNRSPAPAQDKPPSSPSPSLPVAFNQDTFETFVGQAVKPDVLNIIRANCGNDLERAVNMFLDGTWKRFKKSPPVSHLPSRNAPSRTQEMSLDMPEAAATNETMPDARYIGAFGAAAWATKSCIQSPLKHGDVVKIVRVDPATRPPKTGKAALKNDFIVRFATTSGEDIGRLDKNTASWVSTLIDQKVCKFEGICFMPPRSFRTGETIDLQIKAYMLRSAFSDRGFQLADNRSTGRFEQQETLEEKSLRTRQVALVKLFERVDLIPSRTAAADAKNQRNRLIEAAEKDEEKAPAKDQIKAPAKDKKKAPTNDASGTSSESEDEVAEDGEVVEQDQLDALYKKAQSFDFNTPEAEPADTFAMDLRPYQKQALHWMMAKEKDEKSKDQESSMHPLWEEYEWPVKDHDNEDLPQVENQRCFYINPYSGDLSLDFPAQEQHCLGGILADEMGLGKTIQMLSLVHSHRSDVAIQVRANGSSEVSVNQLPRLPSAKSGVVYAPCTTLVVAPLSLLAQWHSEAEKASKEGTMNAIVYYGGEKNVDLRTMCCEANATSAPDVIITSYGTVMAEFKDIATKFRGERSRSRGIFSLNFFRVILDEAHNIKNRQSKTARACYELAAEHRWVLTGTPIVNRLEDLFSLVRFLRVEPWNNFSFWRTFITVPFESKNFMRALDVVQTVLEPLVMRRTKDMKTPDGKPLVPLPPKHVEFEYVELSKPERELYDYIFKRARQTFQNNVDAGTVMKAYTSIFAQILRLRQSCCHPLLVRSSASQDEDADAGADADAAAGLDDNMDLSNLLAKFTAAAAEDNDSNDAWKAAFGANALQQIRDDAKSGECPICFEEMEEQTVTACFHSACKKCLLDHVQRQTDKHEVARCFSCREDINIRDLWDVVHEDNVDDADSKGTQQQPRISLQRLDVNSSKIRALLSKLSALRRGSPQMKSVVFSQFTSFLDIIEPALKRAGMHFLRLDGSLSQKKRAAVLLEFEQSDRFTVFLISLKSGGVGLNLTSAKRVYMMDPWWSFAVEAQAIDRVHRMGQTDEVWVYRFIVKNSVEERMLKVQDRKKFIATSLGMMNDEEQKKARIEDIRELLSM